MHAITLPKHTYGSVFMHKQLISYCRNVKGSMCCKELLSTVVFSIYFRENHG